MPSRDDFRLRLMKETDLEIVLQWRNTERLRRSMYTDHVITKEEHKTWFHRATADRSAGPLIFEYCDRPIGVVNVTQIDKRHNKCVWGFYLGETGIPKGCGSAMGFFALEYIIEQLGFRKVIGEAFAYNIDSIKFHKRLGFVEEGRLVQHVLKGDRYEDVVTMAIFDTTWCEIKPALASKFFERDIELCEK